MSPTSPISSIWWIIKILKPIYIVRSRMEWTFIRVKIVKKYCILYTNFQSRILVFPCLKISKNNICLSQTQFLDLVVNFVLSGVYIYIYMHVSRYEYIYKYIYIYMYIIYMYIYIYKYFYKYYYLTHGILPEAGSLCYRCFWHMKFSQKCSFIFFFF